MSLAKRVIQRPSLAFRHIQHLCCWHMVNELNLLLKNVSSLMITVRMMVMLHSDKYVLINMSSGCKL